MINLTLLPTVLIGEISLYLSEKENDNMFNSCKSLKNDSRFYKKIKLNRTTTLKFFRNEEFRNKIFSRCEQPEKQIYLNTCDTNITIKELEILKFKKIYSLNLSKYFSIINICSLTKIFKKSNILILFEGDADYFENIDNLI